MREFGPFQIVEAFSMINAICFFKRSSKPVIKGSRVESIQEVRKYYKKPLKEGKFIDLIVF